VGLTPNSNIFGKVTRHKSKNNDVCFSKSEVIITNFMIDNNVFYKKEEPYSKYFPIEIVGKRTVDWVIGENIFVEYFGLPEKPNYYKRMEQKRKFCRDYGIILIELYRNDLKKLHSIFKEYIN
jgi:hypothetical protein